MKTVSVVAHAFDCLPAHVTITAKESGFNLRVATARAVSAVLSDKKLRKKHVNDFKISVVVIANRIEENGKCARPAIWRILAIPDAPSGR